MNIDYLYSIVDLYEKKEKPDQKTFLNIRKLADNIEFSFNMKKDDVDKTNFMIPFEEYSSHLTDFLKRYKADLMIIDEKYNYDNINGTCYYYVLFNTGRSISFKGFSVFEMNTVRNTLYDIKLRQNEVRITAINEEKKMPYQPRLRLQEAGFSSYTTIFLIAIFFVDILVIALWIFKEIFK